MSDSDPLLIEDKGAVRWIWMNRPQAMNAITPKMLTDLNTVLKTAEEDRNVRVIVLSGKGRGFCSGLDLKQAAKGEGIGGALTNRKGAVHYSTREICTVTLQRMDKPVIGAINGVAAGYGLDLALGCDLRIMSEDAFIAPAFAKMGIIPESGGTWYLPRLLGWGKACEIAMLGERLSAARSVELGLVNCAVPASEFEGEVTRWAEKIAANAPLAVMDIKRLFRHGLTQDFESHSHHVLMSLLNLTQSNDFNEAVQSFAERRPAEFSGT